MLNRNRSLLYQTRSSMMAIQTSWPVPKPSGLYLGAGKRWLFLCPVLTWECDVIWLIFIHSWRLITLLAQGSLKLSLVRRTPPPSLPVTLLWSISKPGAGLLLHTGELDTPCVQNHVHKAHFWEVLCTLLEKEQNHG